MFGSIRTYVRDHILPIQLPPIVSSKQMGRNLTKLVLPIITFVALGKIQGAEAGFGLFSVCMAACLTSTGGAFPPACVQLCVTTLAMGPV